MSTVERLSPNPFSREGVPRSTVSAYWKGGSARKPMVFAFLVIDGPWRRVLAKAMVGKALIFVAPSAVVGIAAIRTQDSADLVKNIYCSSSNQDDCDY